MNCQRAALGLVLGTMMTLSIAACGPKGDDGAAAPGGDAGAGAPAAQGSAPAAGDAAGGAVGDAAGDTPADAVGDLNATAAVGMIASGTAERPTDVPPPVRPVQAGVSKMMTREDLKKAATMPLFELTEAGPDDGFVYQWVTPRDGETDPTLPMARMIVTQNFSDTFVLTQWAANDSAMPTEEGTASDVTVGSAPAKLWTLADKTVIIWDNGVTRLRIQSTNMNKDALLQVAEALQPME